MAHAMKCVAHDAMMWGEFSSMHGNGPRFTCICGLLWRKEKIMYVLMRPTIQKRNTCKCSILNPTA